MFIKTIKRKQNHLVLWIVENKCIDGKTQQCKVCYLGHLHKSH